MKTLSVMCSSLKKVIFTIISEELIKNMLEKMRVYRLVLFMHIHWKQILSMKFNIHITVESGNIARPLTLRIAPVNEHYTTTWLLA